MIEGEAEYEYIPLQIFLDHFYEGQTYALEMAFAVLQNKFTSLGDDGEFTQAWMRQLVQDFLTKNVQKMVGYAISQSRQYGLKTERYTAFVKASNLIRSNNADTSQALAKWPTLLEDLCKIPHVKMCEVANGAGGTEMVLGIDICNKKFPLTAKWRQVLESIDKTVVEYGNRVKDHEGQPADWKALSHAIRITEQIIELCQHGTITFPRPTAECLLKVKRGELSLDGAKDILRDRFDSIDPAIEESNLLERTPELDEKFKEFKLSLLREYYEV
jgi:hypothetical protein